MSTSPRRIGLVSNPTAGKGQAAAAYPRILAGLRERGHEVVDLAGPSAGVALARAHRATHDGSIDILAVAGGDGMVHLGVNACAQTDVPLLIAALGTGNDIAANLRIPVRDELATLALLDAGTTRTVDLGHVLDDQARPWFGGVLYAGFDAVVNDRANRWRWPRGQMRYNLAVVRELPTFRPIPYAITVDGTRVETEAMLVLVANATSYGGGMQVAPQARMDDGLFDVMYLNHVSRAEFLRVFPKVFSGAHVDHPAVHLIRGRRVDLEAHGITAWADGEPLRPVPLTAEIVPDALRVFAPDRLDAP
ncbi:MAG TPA: YegS/Rv2252/BmrU family lipid kinase [Tetrasphaera sp.]|uniref:diacylglycerol/lipid kinase family protein n=1 Tax=Nostocoides sp. TaxID=1917966 RepID=UPI002C203E93|nr:YegS/Rv2252/BmrU family lipid kinase [Tetrasphaera sp.]HNQ06380.1 YegS/Rv2252/BmrU family lipid kinase [Tetrasphaera sp.]